MALVKLMLPSLIKTLELDKQYQLFVGLDDDDDFWMSELNQEMLRSLATEMMKKQPNGDNSNFLIHFHGFPSKPNHIPFNEIIRTAKKQFNPDYYVRINDDTEFLTTQWATLGMEVLRSFSPPNVGAVGPRCDQGNVKIMTHDMVHKTHMEIFSDEYYPDVFDNWWLDDWISKVYGVNRTQKIDTWIVKHHTAHHGTRYGVNRNHQNLLDGELKKGNSAIKKWLDNVPTDVAPPKYNNSELKEDVVTSEKKLIPVESGNSPHPKTTIAVVICATAKGMKTKNFDNMALVKLMLPSLIKTLELDKQYQLFVGLDDDDDFWMSELNQEMLRSLATEMMKKQPNGDNSNFLIHFHGFPSKPNHIPFNEIIRTAKKQFNPDYYVRINDDTEFLTTQWATLGMEVLRSFSPPNVGAVGPRCDQGNVKIMTHDMVHKTHMEIFSDEYYPDVFDNWWLDDWISKVYGVNRTQKIDTWIVKHHTAHHGTRYGVNRNHQNLLDGELKKGNSAIKKWLLEREKKR